MNLFLAHTIKWVDPDGIKLNENSKQWCDPTKDAGYTLSKEPTKGSKKGKTINIQSIILFSF